ncbi:MAG: hypothetical protein ACD_39C01702G0001 [uncultured bacterium]|nr:MAG: hypothetical protein ACD_39C01702G0001 [uncultured bacterium]
MPGKEELAQAGIDANTGTYGHLASKLHLSVVSISNLTKINY